MATLPQCYVCKNGLYRYKLNRNQQRELWESQDGKCKMCDKPVTLFNGKGGKSGCVDHDHDTNKVRGLVCCNCNTIMGLLHEDIHTLKSMIEYLESHE